MVVLISHAQVLGREDFDFVVIFAFSAAAVAVGLATNQIVVALRLLGAGWEVTRVQATMFPGLIAGPLLGAWLLGGWGFGIGLLAPIIVTLQLQVRSLSNVASAATAAKV
jgi:hypothetical protein